MTLRVLIVDDEPLARASLRAYLSAEEDVEVVGECGDGREAVAAIRRLTPDLVFLDVDMPVLDGFGLLQAMHPAELPVVVFVTAHEEHALRAFDVEALDYLVKPFGMERFRKAFQRVRKAITEQSLQQRQREQLSTLLESLRSQPAEQGGRTSDAEHYLERVAVKNGRRIFFVRTDEIDWIEAQGNYLRLHVGRSSHLIRETLSAIESKLDPRRFSRVHRSTIINLDRVKELRPWVAGDYIVTLKDGTELKLSRSYREKLEELTGKYS